MSEPAPPYLCPKCQGPMEVGFVLDYTEHNVPYQQSWIAGEPEHRWGGNVKARGGTKFNVRTYRCSACGFLESFATEPFK